MGTVDGQTVQVPRVEALVDDGEVPKTGEPMEEVTHPLISGGGGVEGNVHQLKLSDERACPSKQCPEHVQLYFDFCLDLKLNNI
jgi:hypothetical protein